MRECFLTFSVYGGTKMNNKGQLELAFPALVFIAIIVVIFAMLCIAIVPAGHVGVRDTFGQVDNDVYQPGIYFKAPWTGVINMTVQTQLYSAEADAASKDLQDAKTSVGVNYHLDAAKVVQIYKTIKGANYEGVIIVPAVQESVKASTAQYNVDELITQRPKVKDNIDNVLKDRFAQYGIILETTSITDFTFSPDFSSAIEKKQVAQQSAQEANYKLQQVQVEAQQKVAQATGEADAIKVTAEAQAYQLQQISDKLTKNPLLVQYKAIEKWDGHMPKVTGGSTPLVSLDGMLSPVSSISTDTNIQ